MFPANLGCNISNLTRKKCNVTLYTVFIVWPLCNMQKSVIFLSTDCVGSNSDLKEYSRDATNAFIFTVFLLIGKINTFNSQSLSSGKMAQLRKTAWLHSIYTSQVCLDSVKKCICNSCTKYLLQQKKSIYSKNVSSM